jgi:hypothetical protein
MIFVLVMQTVRLRYTPRKMVIHPDFKSVCVVEADHAGVPMAARDEEEPFIPQNGTDASGDLQVRLPLTSMSR